MAVEIREHRLGKDLDDFIRAGHVVFNADPAWVPPLEMDLRERLTPRKNPFFLHGEATLFTAWKNGKLVGRCSAQIDREHLRIHKDETGFFGFFDTLNDPEVGHALLRKAEAWLAERGVKRIRGPYSLNINEEVGLLIDGFEHPPVILMPHSRQYQAGIVESAGFSKCKDLFAWRYDVDEVPARAKKAWEQIQLLPEVRMRCVDKSRMEEELKSIMEIFNDAWKENWGFVPATREEVDKIAKDLKLIIDERVAFFAEINGRPMGICICIPNLNEAIRDIDGKLFPTGLLKILWRMKINKPRSGRLMMLGIREEIRGIKRYGGLSTAMYVELIRRAQPCGYRWAELSWTLEDNRLINLAIKAMGAKIYKTYRIYEKEIAASNPSV
ncbi:MAG: hypothetical protein IPJ88_16920 [Myxococcales bacterium]|nr:MAG: hypothetical protein IPJ88_16920 [Myxococcales bacterium]